MHCYWEGKKEPIAYLLSSFAPDWLNLWCSSSSLPALVLCLKWRFEKANESANSKGFFRDKNIQEIRKVQPQFEVIVFLEHASRHFQWDRSNHGESAAVNKHARYFSPLSNFSYSVMGTEQVATQNCNPKSWFKNSIKGSKRNSLDIRMSSTSTSSTRFTNKQLRKGLLKLLG